jgi:hypothetical protein
MAREPSDHRPSSNVSAAAREKSRCAIGDPKNRKRSGQSARKRLGGTSKAKGVSSRSHHVCYWSNSEVSALREFFAV